MPNYVGLLVLGLIIGGFGVLFLYLNRQQRVETNAEFARERGWQFQDVLPQFGRAQRQHIFQGTSAEGLEWEMIINLKQATTQTLPIASTIWKTDQIRSHKGLVAIGPKLDASFDTFDLSHPLVSMFLRTILGDEADQVPGLKRVPIAESDDLTVLATDNEYGQTIVSAEVLRYYQEWMRDYQGEKYFPILLLWQSNLQIKVKKALTKAAEADAFVNFCVRVAPSVKMNISS